MLQTPSLLTNSTVIHQQPAKTRFVIQVISKLLSISMMIALESRFLQESLIQLKYCSHEFILLFLFVDISSANKPDCIPKH